MSVRKLDRDRKYGTVYGDEENHPKRPKKFYQDGMYFDGAGVAIEGSEIEQPKPTPVSDPPQVIDTPSSSDIILRLNAMSVPKLKKTAKAVNEATGEELPQMSGTGVKARLVAYIAEHAE